MFSNEHMISWPGMDKGDRYYEEPEEERCSECGATPEDPHAAGCLADLTPVTRRCLEPLDLRGKSDAEVKVLLGEQ